MPVITQNGYTALMMAARWGETEIVSLLLKAGANTDLQNKVNGTEGHLVITWNLVTSK